MISDQQNKCAICGNEETRKSRTPGKICRLTLDHCHNTGLPRALLCHACNVAIGHAKDDVELIKRAIDYLSNWKAKHALQVQ